MGVIIKQGNPIILTEADRTKYQPVIEAATLNELDEVSLNADNLTMYGNGTRKTLRYPAGADVWWVVEQVRKFAEVARKAFKAQDATSKRFVQLCADVLKDGGNVTFYEKQGTGYYKEYFTREVVRLHLKKEKGHTFEAECETSVLDRGCVEYIRYLIAEETGRRAEEKREREEERELKRLRELARKHNVK